MHTLSGHLYKQNTTMILQSNTLRHTQLYRNNDMVPHYPYYYTNASYKGIYNICNLWQKILFPYTEIFKKQKTPNQITIQCKVGARGNILCHYAIYYDGSTTDSFPTAPAALSLKPLIPSGSLIRCQWSICATIIQ